MDIKKNDILTVEITDTGTEGEGIGKLALPAPDAADTEEKAGGKAAGFTLFVKDAVIGDIGLILYSDSPDLINTIMFEHGDLYAAFNSAKQVEGNSIFYDDTIISVAKSTVSHLLLMSYNNRSNFIKDFTNLKILLLLGGISIFVLSFFLSLFISLRQYHSVAVIMDSLNDPVTTIPSTMREPSSRAASSAIPHAAFPIAMT